MDTAAPSKEFTVNEHPLNEGNTLPLVVEPEGDRSVSKLVEWIRENHADVEQKLYHHGAILFRNFDVKNAQDFEDIAYAIDSKLKNEYLGTSPRDSRSKYAFSASELPSYYPIPQHCEMSFLAYPPRKLFFYAEVAPKNGGETPIVNFRQVYNDMDPDIRKAFEEKGIKTIRNYDGPDEKPSPLNPFQLKKWNEMFQTRDKKKVEEICEKNKIKYEWDGDHLRLINEQPAMIEHPKTGEKVWFNHLQVFHVDAPKFEYQHIYEKRKSLRTFGVNAMLAFLTWMKKSNTDSSDYAMHCTFLDGTEIPTEYVEHVIDVIWKNMVIFPWQTGDVIAIDNFSTSHGRLPYKGEREILVCWSAD